MESKFKLEKYLDLIQNNIMRMADNSFKIKGWTLSIIGIVFALESFSDTQVITLCGIFIVTFAFWCLDSFYLRTERKYRALYNDILDKEKNNMEIDWYNLDISDYDDSEEIGSFAKNMFSKTIFPLYCPLSFIEVVLIICYIAKEFNITN